MLGNNMCILEWQVEFFVGTGLHEWAGQVVLSLADLP